MILKYTVIFLVIWKSKMEALQFKIDLTFQGERIGEAVIVLVDL